MVSEWQSQLDAKIDRLLNDVEFIKNRTSTYLGRNEALTYLADETPIFVNTDDFGCPVNFLNGGRYEEEYFSVLLSFKRPGATFLDIGANLGVYSLRMAQYLRTGRIHAFEPIERIRNLFSRSVFLNGLGGIIKLYPYAASDRDGEAKLSIPSEHAGGASLEAAGETLKSELVPLRKLDDLMSEDFTCELIKLDVEGHELHALLGMRRIIERSPECLVMFEKLAENSGIEAAMLTYFESLDRKIYSIEGTTLSTVDLELFRAKGGYFVAGRPERVESGGCQRNFLDVYPADLNVLQGNLRGGVLHVRGIAPKGTVLFHGPYWFLPRGYYRLTIEGKITGSFQLDVCERFGYKVSELALHSGRNSIDFPIYRDLSKFELVLRSDDGTSHFEMSKIRVTRLS